MQAIVYRSPDTSLLDRLAKNFRPGKPLYNEEGQRIGSILRIWCEGNLLMAEFECVPEDLPSVPAYIIHLE